MSSGVLREFYLPAYKAAVDAGVAMVMAAFNTVDRIPATGNEQLLRGILREEWGFNGVTIADFNSVNELIPTGLQWMAAKPQRKVWLPVLISR